jgi:hypothetical protein
MYKYIKRKIKTIYYYVRKENEERANQRVTFTGLEGEALVVHGLGVELGEGVGGAAECRVHATIHLVQARGVGLPLLRHGRWVKFFLFFLFFLVLCISPVKIETDR